ncbi:antimicrobial peptide NK-lysin-like [Buteo buteo]|uniref:antimicrobial peptide NK-lysin-like n=1 Tax=Buteo buteo TaxID=30397 RepID=UPI003EBCC5F6
MAPLLLALLTGVTALLLVGAEGPLPGTLLVRAGGPWPGTLGGHHPPPDPEDEDGLQLSDDDIMSGEGVPSGIVRCALCKRVVKALRNVVVDPNDKAGVARVAHRVCGRLPAGAGLCRRLLHHALAPIEEALKHHESPTRLCTSLRWCSPQP